MDTAKPQIMGAAMTYARRYTICAICNIMQDDDDGEAAQEAGKQNGNDFVPMLDPVPAKGNPSIKYPKTTGTTPGAVRAQDNNKYFSEKLADLRAIGNLRDLRHWWAMYDRDLQEMVSPTGYQLLQSEFADRENEFAARISVK
jgi:hypothetical protein